MERSVLLSGEHPTLPQAELRALLDVHDPGAKARPLASRAFRVVPGDAAGTDVALGRMALAHAWGRLWAEDEDSEDGLARLAAVVGRRATGRGTAAVAALRAGDPKSPRAMLAERVLGRALSGAGHAIDLRSPATTVHAWLLGGRAVVGELGGRIDRGRFEARSIKRRAHFHPVGLHPRRAASLLHLARVPPGGTVYDPFCGTGGFLLEAAVEGHRVLGSDIDPVMVQGTLQALADDGPEALDGEAFVADVGEAAEMVGAVDGVVTDLPYGVASGTRREPLEALHGRAVAAVAQVLPAGAHAVLGCRDLGLLPELAPLGLRLVERHEERAHASLTRCFAVVKRDQGVGGPS